MSGHRVYSIRVQNHWTVRIGQHRFENLHRSGRLPHSAADKNRILFFQLFQNLPSRADTHLPPFIRQGKHNRLIELHSFNGVNTLRDPKIHQPCPTAQSTHGRKIRCPGKPSASAKKQNLSETTLMSIGISVRENPQNFPVIQLPIAFSIHRKAPSMPLPHFSGLYSSK